MIVAQRRTSCLESFLHARPAKNQFLVRAYFALGKVQAAYCDGLKSTELLEGTMAALAQVQHGLQLAAELGAAHRFLVYNGSVHLWNVARPLMALPTTAASDTVATSAACSGVRIPNPTATGRSVCLRIRATFWAISSAVAERVPVIPRTET